MSSPVTTHELRRFLAGELAPARRAEVEAALSGDEALRMRAEAMKAEDAAFKASMPFERFVADHEARVAKTASPWAKVAAALKRFGAVGGVGALAAAGAVVVLVSAGDPDPDAAIRTKGGPAVAGIGYFVDEQDGVRVGRAGEALSFGDRIQFAVRGPTDAEAMVVVGVDGEGAVTVYAAESLATREKGAGGARVLTQSVVLDDAVGPERFFVVYGRGPVEALRASAEAAAKRLVAERADLTTTERLPLDDGRATQGSVHIVKVRR